MCKPELPVLSDENLNRVTPEALARLLQRNGWTPCDEESEWSDDGGYHRIGIPKCGADWYEKRVHAALAVTLRSGKIRERAIRTLLAELLAEGEGDETILGPSAQ